jgi:hypothetical protein
MLQRVIRIAAVVSVVAALSMGIVAVAKKPPKPGPIPSACPSPERGCICYMLYAPVVCGPDDCWYSNDCFASCAGWTPSQCTPVGPGPIEL